MKFSVIIVSAGQSSRMCGTDKQFVLLDYVPVIVRSVMAFDNIDCVSEIIVVTSVYNLIKTKNLLSQYAFRKTIKVTEGSDTRQKSVINGYNITDKETDYIAVHDGARPLVRTTDIEKCFENAIKYGASLLCTPVKDTIKISENGFISSTPDRKTIFTAQTPQVFRRDIYKKAIENAISGNTDFTDDCQLVENTGVKIFITEGSYSNIKITTPEDIPTAESYVKEGLI